MKKLHLKVLRPVFLLSTLISIENIKNVMEQNSCKSLAGNHLVTHIFNIKCKGYSLPMFEVLNFEKQKGLQLCF